MQYLDKTLDVSEYELVFQCLSMYILYYRHIEVDDSHIAFKMIKSNVSTVVGQLDDIRKHPK